MKESDPLSPGACSVPETNSLVIAVLGVGSIGGTLARAWMAAGHTFRLGVRAPGKPEVVALAATVQSFADAATSADVVVLASSVPR